MMRGFTLIETIVVIGIVGIIVSILIPLYLNYDHFALSQQSENDVVYSAGKVAATVQAAILGGDAIIPARGVSGMLYTSGTSTLVIETPSIDISGADIPDAYDYLIFYGEDSGFYELTDANSASTRTSGSDKIATHIDSVSFSYDTQIPSASESVDVDVVGSETAAGKSSQTHVHEKIYFRK